MARCRFDRTRLTAAQRGQHVGSIIHAGAAKDQVLT